MTPIVHAVHDFRRSLINGVPQMRDPLNRRPTNFTRCQPHSADVLLGTSFEGWESEVFFDNTCFLSVIIFQTRGMPVGVHQVDVSAAVDVDFGWRQLLAHDTAQRYFVDLHKISIIHRDVRAAL